MQSCYCITWGLKQSSWTFCQLSTFMTFLSEFTNVNNTLLTSHHHFHSLPLLTSHHHFHPLPLPTITHPTTAVAGTRTGPLSHPLWLHINRPQHGNDTGGTRRRDRCQGSIFLYIPVYLWYSFVYLGYNPVYLCILQYNFVNSCILEVLSFV